VTAGLWALSCTAASIGLAHTMIGVDHTLPLIALGRAGGWTRARLSLVTMAVGLAHVGSSVLLGAVGLAVGAAVNTLVGIEGMRGPLAAHLLIGFGLAYATWGLVKSARARSHAHEHVHADGTAHAHPHHHEAEHLHPHAQKSVVTFWGLFLVFGLGPCEPLIPLLMAPALEHGAFAAVLIAAVFAAVTIGTMLALVLLGGTLAAHIPDRALARHADAFAGLAVAVSGLLVLHAGL
jgi:nickel/cobalt transporter (NicO) family protein